MTAKTINKKLVQKHFSQAACSYDDYAVIQKIMAGELLKLMKRTGLINQVQSVLEIGCGTGYLTELILQFLISQNKLITSELLITDISAEMLNICQNKINAAGYLKHQLSFKQMDGEQIILDHPVDLIVANAVFQWFLDLNKALRQINKALSARGSLFFTTFGETTFQELHQTFQNTGNSKKQFQPGQQFITAPELQAIMTAQNFTAIKIIKVFHRQYFPQVRDLFKAIKKIGAANACTPTNGSIAYLGKKRYQEILDYYQTNYCDTQGVYCTYEILYCYGRRS